MTLASPLWITHWPFISQSWFVHAPIVKKLKFDWNSRRPYAERLGASLIFSKIICNLYLESTFRPFGLTFLLEISLGLITGITVKRIHWTRINPRRNQKTNWFQNLSKNEPRNYKRTKVVFFCHKKRLKKKWAQNKTISQLWRVHPRTSR